MRVAIYFPRMTLIALALLLIGATQAGAGSLPSDTDTKTWSSDKRFVDNGNQTITDTKSRLMWAKMDSYLHTGHWISWNEANKYVADLNEKGFAGYYDWKMPTVNELKNLYEADKFNSAQVGKEMNIHIDPIFAKNGGGSSWALEKNGAFNAQGVIFNHGRSFSAPRKSRTRKAVRAVRVVNE